MKRECRVYLLLSVVFVLSFLSAWLLPVGEIQKGLLASPVLLSLIGALYQVFRDEAKHQKDVALQNNQHVFTIGATSHMANTAFNKHVEFCEKYMEEVHNTILVMFREGESESALTHASNLLNIRIKYAAWLTKEMNSKLEPFEQVLREIGAASHFVRSTENSPNHQEARSKKLDEAFNKFCALMNLNTENLIEGVGDIEEVKEVVKGFLGISELTRIREYLVSEATKSIT
jgi:hypothetical protein